MKHLPSTSRAGGTVSVIIRLIFAVALLAGGAQQMYVWVRNRQMASVTLEEFLKKKPDAEWIEIKGGILNVAISAGLKSHGSDQIKELYIPLTKGQFDTGETRVVLHTDDPQYIATINEYNAQPDGGAKLKYSIAHAERLWPKRDIRGLVEFGIGDSSDRREKMAALDMKLAKDAVIIDDGKKPDAVGGGVMLGLGLVLALSFLKFGRRKPGRSLPAPPPVPPASPAAPLPPPPAI